MATVKHNLTSTPVRISTGAKAAYVQSLNKAVFRYAQSATSPNKEVYHFGNELSIPEGFSLWAWNPSGYEMTIVVSTAE